MLKGDNLTDALAELIERHPDGEDAPHIGFIDGALAGLLLLPDVEPEEWLPRVGAGPEIAFADPRDGTRFARLLQVRKAEIAGELLSKKGGFAPLYAVGEEGEPVWQLWLMGFSSVLGLRPQAMDAMLQTDDEDMGTAWSGLLALMAVLPGFEGLDVDGELPDFEEFAGMEPDLLPYLVETIYRRQHGLPRLVLGDGPGFGGGFDDYLIAQEPVRVSKIGRNEPCPCGSGKKYKKCCGG